MKPEDFLPARKRDVSVRISRPSLSYWQDAWIRLKKNRQATASLWIVVTLALFTIAGPWIWTLDPSFQLLAESSLGPTLGREARVIGPDTEAQSNQDPTTAGVPLNWEPLDQADGYAIYRAIQPSRGLEYLGLPLAELRGVTTTRYIDRMSLEPRTYWYTVIALKKGRETETFVQFKITPKIGLKLEDAQRIDPHAIAGSILKLPAHPFGTDSLGRDLLARIIAGARVSLSIGFFAPILYILIGVTIGGFAGLKGGRTDLIIVRVTDLVVALPFLLFMILLRIAFGVQPGESGIMALLAALILLSWPSAARLVRGQVLQLREAEYVQAARLLGAGAQTLLWRHLVPNTLGVILVSLTFAIPSTIFTEAFLSFIGMGVVPPTPSWGSLCNDGIQSFLTDPHEFLFPAGFISVTVLAFNLLGDGLRDALDPKQRGVS
ncbi:MAG: ABC transporter permease subunit [Oligoflexia bacterium]